MNKLHYNLLNERAIIVISGSDRVSFLQGLLTNDVNKAHGGSPIYSLMLSPQGKFLHDFFIISHDEQFYIDCCKNHLKEIINKLSMYKLRSKVEIIDKTNECKILFSQTNIEQGITYKDPRFDKLGFRSIVPCDMEINISQDLELYEVMRTKYGIPEGYKDMQQDKSFPLEYGMDKLNAIDFNKGCYVGQEVTSRTKYRGTLRKKIYIIAGKNLPSYGEDLIVDDKKIGIMCSKYKEQGIALIREENYLAVKESSAPIYNLTLPEWGNND